MGCRSKGTGIATLPANADILDQLVKAYLANVEPGRSTEAEAKELHRVLLRDVVGSGEKTRLVVSADGELSLIPFDALVRADGRYAIADHVVSYVSSGTFLWLPGNVPLAKS